jgi:DNA invertase Pin-like site-specific DNA recombinase
MFGIEQQKYRKLSISDRNDKILQMKLKGHSPAYLAMLFDLPQIMVDAQMIDKRSKVNEEQKNKLLEYCKTHPHKKDREEMAGIMGINIRTVYRLCKEANITGEEDNLVT